MKFNDKCGTDLSSSAFDTSFPVQKKVEKGVRHQEEKGTKYTKGLFPLRVPSLLCFLRAGKEETTAQRFREIGILIMVVRETRTMA